MHTKIDSQLYFNSNNPIWRIFSKYAPWPLLVVSLLYTSPLHWCEIETVENWQFRHLYWFPFISQISLSFYYQTFIFNSLMLLFSKWDWYFEETCAFFMCVHICIRVHVWELYSCIFTFTLKVTFSLRRVTLLHLVFSFFFLLLLLLWCWGWNPECCACLTGTLHLGYTCSSDVFP